MREMISDLRVFLSSIIMLYKLRSAFPNSRIHPGVYADRESFIGFCSVLFRNVLVVNSSVGNYTYIQQNSQVINADIGPYCSIAQEVVIGLIDHPTNFVSSSPVFYDNRQPLPQFFVEGSLEPSHIKRTVIGADTWIGQRAMIKSGVTIGVGAVIGAGSIVTSNVEPYTIVVGTPARVLRRRFSKELSERLLATQWWLRRSYDLIELNQVFDDPEAFVAALENKSC